MIHYCGQILSTTNFFFFFARISKCECYLIIFYIAEYQETSFGIFKRPNKSWVVTDIADRTTLGSPKRIDDKKKIMGTLSDTIDDQRQKCLPQQLEEQKISNKESELPNRRAEESYKSTEKLEERIEESDVRA